MFFVSLQYLCVMEKRCVCVYRISETDLPTGKSEIHNVPQHLSESGNNKTARTALKTSKSSICKSTVCCVS